jgi:hypothetical protein
MTRMGQKTGMLKQSKNVQITATTVDFVTEYQNLNSGSRRMNGRNSSFAVVGSSGPSSKTFYIIQVSYTDGLIHFIEHSTIIITWQLFKRKYLHNLMQDLSWVKGML